MHRFTRTFAASALAAVLAVSGCNLLDAAYAEGGGVEESLEDARIARINGDFETAERLLRDAYEQDPANAVVRLELATTLMQRNGVNSVSLVADLSSFVTDAVEGIESPRPGGARSGGEVCSYTTSDPDRADFDPTGFEGYGEIIRSLGVLREVRDLLAGDDGAVLPASLLGLSPCDVIVDGQIVDYGQQAVLDELYDTFGGDRNLVATALQLNAFALILEAYTGIFEQADLPVAWYLVGSEDNRRIGFCADDPAALDQVYDRIDAQVADVGRALFSIDLLVRDGGDETLQDLRDEAVELYVTFQEDISRYCN